MDNRDSFEKEEGALLRARLHLRSGRRRLRQGKISTGIVTLYDAFLFALRWYVASPERRKALSIREEDDLKDEKNVIDILRRSKIPAAAFDYASFNAIVDRASEEEMPDYDYSGILRDFEAFMTGLGVMPFDEAELPPEDPATF
jgi:hypothetical protein